MNCTRHIIKRFDPSKFPCPVCRTKHPDWKRHATYERYISASAIYSWRALFLKNKKIWLGLLEDACITAADYIKAFLDKYIYVLEEFYLESNLSFLQTPRKRINAHSPP
jgi:hypothetical protein